MSALTIRPASKGDTALIYELLHEFAVHDDLMYMFQITPEIVDRDYLSDKPLINCDLAFEGTKPAGIASWYWKYTSFAAKRVLYLEDIYIRPTFRGKGYGTEMLARLAREALNADAARMEWSVEPKNTRTIALYERLGAKPVTGWNVYRLTGAELAKLGEG